MGPGRLPKRGTSDRVSMTQCEHSQKMSNPRTCANIRERNNCGSRGGGNKEKETEKLGVKKVCKLFGNII